MFSGGSYPPNNLALTIQKNKSNFSHNIFIIFSSLQEFTKERMYDSIKNMEAKVMKDKLKKELNKIAYTSTLIPTKSNLDEAIHGIMNLFDSFGYATTLYTISQSWSYDKSLDFFEKYPFSFSKKDIKTIGTYYRRAYAGGIERVQSQLINLWTNMGYNVVLFTEEPESKYDYPYPSSTKRVIIPSATNLEQRLVSLQEIIYKEKIDVYINHYWSNSSILWECTLFKLNKIPYLIYAHGNFSSFYGYGKWALDSQRVFKQSNLLISLSETNARFYQLCGCKTYLVQNPIPDDLISVGPRDCSPLKSKRILFIGRLHDDKLPMDMINIFKLVHEHIPDSYLDIVGSDEDSHYSKKIINFCHENLLDNYVVFHGQKKADELADFYRNASILLFTTKSEGYPMVLLEAKAYGLPIVMNELPYLTLVKDNLGILSAPVGDITTMAKHIIKLLSDTNLREQFGLNSRSSFETFKSYKLNEAWKNIFSICSGNDIISKDYYLPNQLTISDQLLMPMLLTNIKKGYEFEFNHSKEYVLGKKILYIPRIIKKRIVSIISMCKRS